MSTARRIFEFRLHSHVPAHGKRDEEVWNAGRIRNARPSGSQHNGPGDTSVHVDIDIDIPEDFFFETRFSWNHFIPRDNMSPAMKITEPNLDISFQG